MTIQLWCARRPVLGRTHVVALGLFLLGAVVLLGLYLTTPHVEVAFTPALSEPSVSHLVVPGAQNVRSACTLTGDLVGDANPAEVARVLCGDPNQRH